MTPTIRKSLRAALAAAAMAALPAAPQAAAQTLEEYARQQDALLADYTRQNDEALARYAAEMDRRLAQLDRQWAEYLKQRFAEHPTLSQPKPAGARPKPAAPPAVGGPQARPRDRALDASHEPAPALPREARTPPLQKSVGPDAQAAQAQIDFYGARIRVEYPRGMASLRMAAPADEQAIADHYAALSATDYGLAVNSLMAAQSRHNLNDYALYLLIREASGRIAPTGADAALLRWFLMLRMGYKAKVGYADGEVYTLVPSAHEIYDTRYVEISDTRYYMLEGGPQEGMRTYSRDFPEARQVVSMDMLSAVDLGQRAGRRELAFRHLGSERRVTLEYNRDLCDLLDQYPPCDPRVYFDAAPSGLAKASIAAALRPMVEGLPEAEAAGLLLAFTQTAFSYQTDQEQFGRPERFLFAEELLRWPHSDCEDRSVFFAYCVRELLGLEVAALAYDGHMATAVRFGAPVAGFHVARGADRLTVCDPTVEGAPAGVPHPGYADARPRVVELRSRHNAVAREADLWRSTMLGGGLRGGNGRDAATDSLGNVYLTGYYAGEALFGGRRVESEAGSRDMFVARYDPQGQLEWVLLYGGPGHQSGFAVQVAPGGDIHVACSYSQGFRMGGKLLPARAGGDIAVARISPDGDLLWATPVGLERTGADAPFMFVARLDARGRARPLEVFAMSEDYGGLGLHPGPDGGAVLTGSNLLTAGLLPPRQGQYAAAGTFSAADAILAENRQLLDQDYDPSVAGLFAAIKLLNNSAVTLEGTEVQKTLDRHNPSFRKLSPAVYESLGQIQFIRNAEGIITIKTRGGGHVEMRSLRVANNARFKASAYSSGTRQIDVMNGIDVGKSIIWYSLNSAKITKAGEMIVDYDTDHSKIRMDMRRDILQ